ncbi:MAG: FecR domain-containing protein [Lachnospiraceae bacterium]|nr:FecR domain-containing protein [Lachnospiraceae bacterium]
MSKTTGVKNLTKALKIKIGVGAGALLATAAIVTGVFLAREESFRTIAVEETSGTTLVVREKEEPVNAYEGMHLYSGDDVSVQKESDMTMVLDMDKYVYAQPETHFWLECAGTAEESNTVIRVSEGSVLSRITDNLNEGEVYKVDTPNSTMAVRGTVFRVTVYRGEDGLVYTLLEVFEGVVEASPKTEEGEYTGVSESFGPGEAALIRGNVDFSEFVRDGEVDWVEDKSGTIKLPIAYKNLPQDTARVLVRFMDDGDVLSIGKELLMDYAQLAEHRMVTKEGKAATCTETGYEEVWCEVCNEVTKIIELPALGHAPGDWEVTKEATCEETGARQKVCSLCKTVCDTEEMEELGHQPGEAQITRNATCTRDGEQVRYCVVCEKEIERVVVKAPGHKAGDEVVVTEATCTEDGMTVTKCLVCGKTVSEETIPKTGHTWGNWETISTASCTTQGREKRTCSSCGISEEQSTGGGTHNWVWTTTLDPTCDEAGEQAGNCSACGATTTSPIAATGHSLTWTPVQGSDFPCMEMSIGVCNCGYEETQIVENHIYERHEHMDHDIHFETGDGTVSCVMACSICGQYNETPIHTMCPVTITSEGIKCACGVEVPY